MAVRAALFGWCHRIRQDMGKGRGPPYGTPRLLTFRNIAFSEALREKEGLVSEGRLLVVSDDYHVFRALLIARALGIAADGAGAKVRLYFALNALVREWVAYVCLKRAAFLKLALAVLALYTALCLLTASV